MKNFAVFRCTLYRKLRQGSPCNTKHTTAKTCTEQMFATARFLLTGEYFDHLYFAKISFDTVKYRRNFAENRFREMSAENKEQNLAKFVGITFA